MPVSKMAVAALRLGERGRRAMDRRCAAGSTAERAVVAGSPDDVDQASERGIADRHGDRAAGRADRDAALSGPR